MRLAVAIGVLGSPQVQGLPWLHPYLYLAVTVAVQRQHDAGSGLDAALIPVTVPELLRLLRGTVTSPPRRDRPHRLHWSAWQRRHQYRAREAH